jgi:hypothetical protein
MSRDNNERRPFYKLRNVSELRTQYQCEYKLHLDQRFGRSSSIASIMGSKLHERISEHEQSQIDERKNRYLPLLIIILTLIIGLFWILW